MAARFGNFQSVFSLDFVRPDFILLKVLFRALIMWDQIKPTKEWVEAQVPQFLRMLTPSEADQAPVSNSRYHQSKHLSTCRIQQTHRSAR